MVTVEHVRKKNQHVSSDATQTRWRRRFFLLLVFWGVTTFALSFPPIRGFVAIPLYENDSRAEGDVAYVMAGGLPYLKRLRAASDLYHWERVQRIVISNEKGPSGYNFKLRQSQSRAERAIDYLELHGVPRERISLLESDANATFGSLSEARAFANSEKDLGSVVVVTSAPHTRRSGLAFRRSLPPTVRVQVYAASIPRHSSEIHSPLWIEYAKLVVYYLVA